MKLSPTLPVVCITLLLASSGLLGRTKAQEAKKFDQFNGPNWENAMAHLDNLALSLQNEPATVGVIFVYGGQKRRRNEPNAWSKCIKDYLVMRRNIDVNRLVFVSGGYRENLSVELWSARDQTEIPKPSPSIKPSTVRFTGRAIANWRSLCSL